jgi:transcription initiation factor IIE alpha subunit
MTAREFIVHLDNADKSIVEIMEAFAKHVVDVSDEEINEMFEFNKDDTEPVQYLITGQRMGAKWLKNKQLKRIEQ